METTKEDSTKVRSCSMTPLPSCCQETIEKLAKNNPMMVCQGCRILIKLFTNPVAFRNYVIFCESRSRRVKISQIDSYYVVTYRAYESA